MDSAPNLGRNIFDHFNLNTRYFEDNAFLKRMSQIKVVWFEEDP